MWVGGSGGCGKSHWYCWLLMEVSSLSSRDSDSGYDRVPSRTTKREHKL